MIILMSMKELGMWHMVEMKYANRVLVEKPEGTRALEGPRPLWENDVTSYFQAKGLEAVDWM
jgi:hypothetical protein